MAHINLLPWREEGRKQREREFFSLAIFAAIISLLIIFLVHSAIQGLIEHQNQRNQYLHLQTTLLNKKISKIQNLNKTKRSLLNRMKIVERLEANRPAVVHLFEQLVTISPQGLYLTDFSQRGDAVSLSGIADSNARVSTYLRNLDASHWFADAKLELITAKKTSIGTLSNFRLTVKQTTPTQKKKVMGN